MPWRSRTLKLKNGGNIINRPSGNIFIQKSLDSNNPITTLPVNQAGAYILPGVSRSITQDWSDGFPVYTTNATDNKSKLQWNFGRAQNFRFGHYVAKAVVVYNDGNRDVPVMASLSFWVLPYKLMIVGLLVLVVLVIGVVTIVRKTTKVARRKREKTDKN